MGLFEGLELLEEKLGFLEKVVIPPPLGVGKQGKAALEDSSLDARPVDLDFNSRCSR